ncbi:PREDICTED: zinc finger BED domain-containing protein DAYSLEEPER-like isoform X2 [Ipomoea nil]|uniref:zinc finger BED domain-containing protein DAYSLEEPER-like isoform X2 n=1 Tax=Ipomoea nil TaxID=35883 RepID=UPI000901EEEE|nr:PREDICTED: zinc finger BED domain-containing protein DAYSLEEPER-like isoform X2 [Ipomoea nil]
MATPVVPTAPEIPTENKEVAAHEEMAAHNEVVAHNGMVAHGEVVAHDDMVDQNDQSEMVAHNDMVAQNEMVAHDDMVAQNEMVAHDDMVAQNEMVAHDDMVAQNEMVPHNDMVAQNEMAPHNDMVAQNEMVGHDDMVAQNEMVAHNDMVAQNEMVAHNDMATQNEMVSHDEMMAHDEMVAHDDVMAHNEIVAQDEMVSHDEMVGHDEMVAHGEMLAHGEMMAHGEMVEHGEMVAHHELIPHDEMLFNNNVDNNEIVPMETPMDYIETPPNSLETQPNKRRKKKSIVWEHFTIETVGNGCRRACCKQCKQSFAYSQGSKVAGTSHLKRHIAKGACPVVLRNQQQQQQQNNSPYSEPTKLVAYEASTEPPKRRYRTASTPFFAFDPDRCRHEISRMIIMHEYPLHMVEHPGFVAFVRNLQPRFDMVSFNTVQGDCVATYLREKQSIQKVIEGMPGRICLTLDMWSSCLKVGYVFITGQFLDSEWKIHRKILNVIMEPYPDSDTAFSHAIAACLSDWSMEGKLFSVTINQPLTDNNAAENVRALLSVKNPLILNGQLLLGNCLAHTLSSIAEDALKYMHETVKKVRDSVKYVKTSESHEEKFLELKYQLQVPSTKVLTLDDKTQWNTTYEMLLAASELKEVFSCLDTSDPDYTGGPSMDDWKKVETLCAYLKILFDTANLLTAPTISTTNTFFHEAWKIQLELARAAASEDPFISGLTKSMQEMFDNYWKSCCLILAIAVVMDPRFKMKLVEFSFSKIYGDDAAKYVKFVDEGIHELFMEYVALPLPLTPTYIEEANGGAIKTEDEGLSGNGLGFSDFDVYIMETTSQQSKSELDQYLEESLLPRVHEFDVVGWWKLNRKKYPTLSKMARDILTVPVCTVPADSVFCTASKEMSSYRCSLRPETVEALICAKDWLQNETTENMMTQPIKMEVPI